MSKIKNGIIDVKDIWGVKVIIDLIPPENTSSNPNTPMIATKLCQHNSGNSRKGADEYMHTEFVDNTDEEVSWHLTLGDSCLIQEMRLDRMAYHAGRKANRCSIGTELMEDEGQDWNLAKLNQLKVNRFLRENLTTLESDTDDVITAHRDWTGKYCPHLLLDEGWDRWKAFNDIIMMIPEDRLSSIDKDLFFDNEEYRMGLLKDNTLSDWAKSGQTFVKNNGISDGSRPNDSVLRKEQWRMFENYDAYRDGRVVEIVKNMLIE